MRCRRAALLTLVLLVGCSDDGAGPASSTPASSPATAASGGSPAEGFFPPPDATVPARAEPLAGELERVTVALRRSIDAWTSQGDPSSWPPPRDAVLQAMYQQRIYGALSSHPGLVDGVVRLLPDWLRDEARANATAGAELLSLIAPSRHPADLRLGHPPPADVLLGYYRQAEGRFGVAWEVLAAVNFIESRFGRVRSASYAGARGPMQFIPATWRAFGLGGDVRDPRDAILGAANYLDASGAPGNYRDALYAYNPSRAYVHAVLLYARQMIRAPRNYYAYYNWQVYSLTTQGLRCLSCPGS